jgi:hypothetical protein
MRSGERVAVGPRVVTKSVVRPDRLHDRIELSFRVLGFVWGKLIDEPG